MNREYKEKLSRSIEKKYVDLEDRIMQDIVRRIRKTGEITSTADWQINRLRILGNSSEDIEQMIKEALDATYPEMFELYDKVIDWEYVRNKDIYEQINAEFIPYKENKQLQQITDAMIQQSSEELENITQSLGFYLDYGGKRVMTPLSQVYSKYLDEACMDIVSGAFDYNSVLRRTVTQLTNSGLRTIDYASGYHSRANVAARRAVMTGITQLTGRISEMNAEKLGTEYFEVAWHAGARPTHAVWQGRVWSKLQLVDVCGLGSVTGLCGANCYHEYYPFFPGISERNWSDEWLDAKMAEENKPREWFGKEYTLYEATQKQRQIETAMRAQREKVRLLEAGGADPDEVMLQKAKYQGQLNEYARFCKKMDLKQDRARIYLDMQGRVATNTKAQNARYTPEMIKNATHDRKEHEKIRNILGKEAGSLAEFRQMKYNNVEKYEYTKGLFEYIKKYPTSDKRFYDVHLEVQKLGVSKKIGVPVPAVPKQAFIMPSGKRDQYHIMHRMLERQITDDDLRKYMKSANVMFIQMGGTRQAFYSDNGVAVIMKSGEDWVFKTAWSNLDFDENTEHIMEVINKHVK